MGYGSVVRMKQPTRTIIYLLAVVIVVISVLRLHVGVVAHIVLLVAVALTVPWNVIDSRGALHWMRRSRGP
jgi:hypothetical protein